MPDIFSKQKRSWLMGRVLSRRNKSTEIRLAAIFREHKIIGWRRGYPLFGKPDFVFPKPRVALFVDGCFWHGCAHHKPLPKSNRVFWVEKIEGNINRDQIVTLELEQRRWHVIRIWEHELKGELINCKLEILRKHIFSASLPPTTRSDEKVG